MRLAPILLVACLAMACTEDDPGDSPRPPRCGDGTVQAGEDAVTCCADAGCPRGVCDPAAMACVDPWTLTCPTATGLCALEPPWVCSSNGPPSYDCDRCGCGDAETCFEGVCYPEVVPALERYDLNLPRDWPIADYFAFLHGLRGMTALTYADLVSELDARRREDRRRVALLLGESHGSADEQAVAYQILRDITARGFGITEIGIEGGSSPILDLTPVADLGLAHDAITGDLTNDAYCGAATHSVGTLLNNEGTYVQYTGSGHTSQEDCHHPDIWGICNLPHTAECITAIGRKAQVVILFDPDIWYTRIDSILMWRAGDSYPSGAAAVTTALADAIAAFEGFFAEHALEPAYAATANGREVNVRVVEAQHAEDVFIAYFPRPTRRATLMRGFASIWADAGLQGFLLSNDVRPGDCSVSWTLEPGNETFWYYCENDAGYGIEAQVDGITFLLESSSTHGP